VSARKLAILKTTRDFGILPQAIFVKSAGYRGELGWIY